MEPIEILKWLIPGSVIAAALLTIWRWLTRSWRTDMEIRAGRLKELAEFEKNIEAAYGRDQMKEFEPLIDQMKRPALEATATRMLVLRDKKSFWDILLFIGGGLIALSALVSLSPLGESLVWPLSLFSIIGLAIIFVFIVVMIIDECKAKKEAKSIVSKFLAQPKPHATTEQEQVSPDDQSSNGSPEPAQGHAEK